MKGWRQRKGPDGLWVTVGTLLFRMGAGPRPRGVTESARLGPTLRGHGMAQTWGILELGRAALRGRSPRRGPWGQQVPASHSSEESAA